MANKSFSSAKTAFVCSFRASGKNHRHLGCRNVMRSRGCAVQNKGITLNDVFGLLSSANFATMATWRNDLSSLLSRRLVLKEKGKVFYGSQILLLLIHSARVSSQNGIFFQSDTFLGFGCNATAVSDAGIWHDSSSESTEVPVGRVKLISFDDVTTKLGPILRSAR